MENIRMISAGHLSPGMASITFINGQLRFYFIVSRATNPDRRGFTTVSYITLNVGYDEEFVSNIKFSQQNFAHGDTFFQIDEKYEFML